MSNPIVSFDEQAVKDELRELVGKTIEETINAMLDEEADRLVDAGPYERAAYRPGRYERGFTTASGQVTLKMPKLKSMRFATAVIERYKRRETSVEEAIIEMYLAGVSTRRIEDVSEILWGAGFSAGTVSKPERQGAQGRGRMEMPSSGPRIPVRLHRRHLPEAQLGRLLRERGGHGGDRRERGRLPRGDRLRRGLRRVVGVLARLPVVAQIPRAARRAHVRRRQGGRHGRLDRRGLPQRQIPALHRALLPQRPRQGRGRGRRPGIDAAQGGRQGGARRVCRDAGVLRDAARALTAHSDEQRHRAAEQGNPPPNPRRRHVPRREIRADAGDRQAEIHSRKRVGPQALPRRIAARREGGQDVGR